MKTKTKLPLLLTVTFVMSAVMAFGQAIQDGKALFQKKQYAEAEKKFSAISNSSKDFAEAQYFLGRMAYSNKDFDKATDYLNEACESNSNSAEYFNWLGNAYAAIARDANFMKKGVIWPKAKAGWIKASELDNKHLDSRLSLVRYYCNAPSFMGGSLSSAKVVANEILTIKEAEGHWQLGNILLLEKNTIDAETEFSKMVRVDSNYKRNMASYYVDKGSYLEAFKLLDEILKKDNTDIIANFWYGKACALSKTNLSGGKAALTKYLSYLPSSREPSLAQAHLHLGQIHEAIGNKQSASSHYTLAINLDENLKDAEAGLERTK